jgi:hypothetical protein
VDLLLKSSLRITGLLSVNWADVGPLLPHRGASQERRAGLDLGYNIRAKNPTPRGDDRDRQAATIVQNIA